MSKPTPTALFTPTTYADQLNQKHTATLEEFAPFGINEVEVFPSAYKHYRMRAEFKVWHEGDQTFYAMHHPGVKNSSYIITEFPQASTAIQKRMWQLLEAINQSQPLKHKLFQAEFLTSTTDECVISLIYHKPLNDDWRHAAQTLTTQLNTSIIGRSRKQKIIIGKDWVKERLTVNDKTLQYQQVENSFTQPNAEVCQHMLNWAKAKTANKTGDLLELYCGNGNFSIALADNFEKILATEISKPSIRSAQFNCNLNSTNNIEFVRMSSEELTQALNKVRPFRRLKDVNLDSYNFTTLLVDPPRAGLDQDTCMLASQFHTIVYISCNPDTLKRDIHHLHSTHKLTEMALFDQFPYTDHRECGAILQLL